ncbi:MAG: hypothetical protein ACHP7M_04195 [Burkholderiales bacterium]|jgi:hypothetical protein
MTTTLRALIAAGVVIASFGLALAKLPPMDDAAKAAAAAKKEKDAAAAVVTKAQLAKAEDRAVANYMSAHKGNGKAPQMGAGAGQGKTGANGKMKK